MCLSDYIVSVVTPKDDVIVVPNTSKQVMTSLQSRFWSAAMKAEIESLIKHGTWKHILRSSVSKKHPVTTNKWVFALKRDHRGVKQRCKALLEGQHTTCR